MTFPFRSFQVLARSQALVFPALLVLLTRCGSGNGLGPNGSLSTLVVAPNSATVNPGQGFSFQANGTLTNGSPVTGLSVNWSATGGTITSGGRYTAGSTAGQFRVVASDPGSGLADTAAVTITVATIRSLAVSPSFRTLLTRQSVQYAATASMSDGSTNHSPAVTWSATGGTISAGGLYTAGPDTGTFVVAASSANGHADTATVHIVLPTPVDTVLRHAPAGLTTIIDEPWNVLQPSGWNLASFGQDKVAIVQDSTAPKSPLNVIQFTYTGNVGGEGAGARSYVYPGRTVEYIALWWKHSSNWQYHSSCFNKLIYFASNESEAQSNNNQNIIVDYCGTIAVEEQNGISRLLKSNVDSTELPIGEWHFLEMAMTGSTAGQSNGTLDFWVDGVQRGHYTDVVWNNQGVDAVFNGIDFDPIWGGGPETVNGTMYYWVDHLIVMGN
ncbi:MAG TPA: hypothetical protein VMG41_05370 [Gemmatimonadales bacterium]|nr:hypothetical protein [Gemmatimonadales bacterium]